VSQFGECKIGGILVNLRMITDPRVAVAIISIDAIILNEGSPKDIGDTHRSNGC
jgi:hypothetical protein